MILNYWSNHVIGFYCMNHEEPIPMSIKEGTSRFYACPRYFAMDKAHPDGHTPAEPPCMNRISFDDATKIVEKLMEIISEDLMSDVYADYNGMEFSFKSITVTVLQYEEKNREESDENDPPIKLGIYNHMAIGR